MLPSVSRRRSRGTDDTLRVQTGSVPTILRAHCFSLYATSPLPPSFDSSAPLYSLSDALPGLHWASFARMCDKGGVEDVNALPEAAEEWLGRWLRASRFDLACQWATRPEAATDILPSPGAQPANSRTAFPPRSSPRPSPPRAPSSSPSPTFSKRTLSHPTASARDSSVRCLRRRGGVGSRARGGRSCMWTRARGCAGRERVGGQKRPTREVVDEVEHEASL